MVYLIVAIYALLELLITLLLQAAVWIASQIVNTSVTTFADGTNIIESFIGLLTQNSGAETIQGAATLISVLTEIGSGFLVVMCVISIIRSSTEASTGKEARHPLAVAGKGLIALMIYVFFFGTGFTSYTGFLPVLGEWMGKLMNLVVIDVPTYEAIKWTSPLNTAEYLGVCLLYATLLSSVIGAAISYIERVLTFALTTLMGPICISMYAYSETESTAKQWITSILVQFGCIFMSLALWSVFLQKLILSDGSLFQTAILIVILNLMKNSEKIFNELGFHTMPNTDSARSVATGFAALMTAASAGGSIAKRINETPGWNKFRSWFETPADSLFNGKKEKLHNIQLYSETGDFKTFEHGTTVQHDINEMKDNLSTLMGNKNQIVEGSLEKISIAHGNDNTSTPSLVYEAYSVNSKNESEIRTWVKPNEDLPIGSTFEYKGAKMTVDRAYQFRGERFYTAQCYRESISDALKKGLDDANQQQSADQSK